MFMNIENNKNENIIEKNCQIFLMSRNYIFSKF